MAKEKIYRTKDGQTYKIRVTYEVIAEKTKNSKKGTVVMSGQYKNIKDAKSKAKKYFQPPKKKQGGGGVIQVKDHVLDLPNFRVVSTTERKNLPGQVGGLFNFTYQLNGKTVIHDRSIEAYSKRTKNRTIASLSSEEISRLLNQAEHFATVQFLQEIGLETANITLIEFIPPIRYKYYMER